MTKRKTLTRKCWEKLMKDHLKNGVPLDVRWLDYLNFLADMGEKPKGKGLHLARYDTKAPYGPDNCSYLSLARANQIHAKRYDFGGKSLTIQEWSKELGLTLSTTRRRLLMGGDPTRSVVQKRNPRSRALKVASTSYYSTRAKLILPSSPGYDYYGGRGYSMCPEWGKLKNFLDDMGAPPLNKTSVCIKPGCRVFNKSNCYWGDISDLSEFRKWGINFNIAETEVEETPTKLDIWAKKVGAIREKLSKVLKVLKS